MNETKKKRMHTKNTHSRMLALSPFISLSFFLFILFKDTLTPTQTHTHTSTHIHIRTRAQKYRHSEHTCSFTIYMVKDVLMNETLTLELICQIPLFCVASFCYEELYNLRVQQLTDVAPTIILISGWEK